MSQLLIGITVTLKDWLSHRGSIIDSVSNITGVESFNGGVLLIVQSEEVVHSESLGIPKSYDFIVSSNTGVSSARNEVLKFAKKFDYNFLILHDACAFFTKGAGGFFCGKLSSCTKKIRQVYSDNVYECKGSSRFYKANPIYQTYLGSYLLNVNYIDHEFDESRGPGSLTDLHSGEDVLFLFQYFHNIGSFYVEEFTGGGCFHPPRDTNYSKHLLYAKGQGALYRVLLKRYLSIRLLRDFIMFCANSLIRVFLFKRNATEILKLRFKGFVNGYK